MIPDGAMVDDFVVLFSAGGCPACRSARAHLQERGADFLEWDISADERGFRLMVTLTGDPAVPTIAAGGEVAVGFDPVRIDEILVEFANRPPEPPDVLDEEEENNGNDSQ